MQIFKQKGWLSATVFPLRPYHIFAQNNFEIRHKRVDN